MPTEIERKFLLRDDGWRAPAAGSGRPMRQGYLCADGRRTVRVRQSGERGWLTIKGPPVGIARPEFEYEIPGADAAFLLDRLCDRPVIEKTRWTVSYGGHVWEIDEFAGENAGLVVAEVELKTQDERVELPPWVGPEVTGDGRYSNSSLVRRPYSSW